MSNPTTIPSLGTTADAVLRAWMIAQPRLNCQTVVGWIVCGGGTYDWREGKLHRVFPPEPRKLATFRPATKAECAEVEEAVRKGWLQIEDRPVSGVHYGEQRTGLGTLVLHRATGREIPES